MKKSKLTSIIIITLALVLSLALFAGCQKAPTTNDNVTLAEGGVLCLKVNPEIAITYDADGNVTKVASRNEDAKKLLENYTGYQGKECKAVVAELVKAIGDAGYFVEEIEGEKRQITIEIESGSKLPDDQFLDGVVAEVRNQVNTNQWQSPVDVRNESDYGITDYVDTDYGPDNDGVTDYTDYGPTKAPVVSNPTQAPAATKSPSYNGTDYGVTDYDDTDYGPNNDGVTDYNDTDYGPNNDGVTDYDDTDYGPNNDGVTDYNDTNYNDTNYGDSRYDDSNYGN